MTEEKICVKCEYCRTWKHPEAPAEYHMCRHYRAASKPDPVTGSVKYMSCREMREYGECMDGELFEPRKPRSLASALYELFFE